MTQQDIQKLDPSEIITLTGGELQLIVLQVQKDVLRRAYIDQDEIYLRQESGFTEQYYRLKQLNEEIDTLRDTLGIAE